MKRKIITTIAGCLSFLCYLLVPAAEAAVLDIGQDLEFEYRSLRHQNKTTLELRHRLRLYMDAYLPNDIDIGARIQSAGILNSNEDYITTSGNKVENKTPFFDLAYIRLNSIHDYPVSLTMGIQSIRWLDGLLINDAGLGLGGASVKTKAPLDIGLEGYRVLASNRLRDISNIDGRGIRAYRYFDFVKLEANYLTEEYDDSSGDSIQRIIYGANLTRELSRGLEFSLFRYIMEGKIEQKSFDSSLIGAYGRFEGRVDPIGRGGAWIRYLVGSGNVNDERKAFMPVLSSAESGIIGHYYSSKREMSTGIDLSYTLANLDLFSYGLYASPVEDVVVSMTRSLYKSQDPSLPIAGALSLGASYTYDRIHIALDHTVFAPEEEGGHEFFEGISNTRYMTLKVGAKF